MLLRVIDTGGLETPNETLKSTLLWLGCIMLHCILVTNVRFGAFWSD